MMNWRDQRVLVSGGAGFLGNWVVQHLRARGCQSVLIPRSAQYNLVDGAAVRRLVQDTKPDIVIHLAAKVGGIGANRAQPATFFYENLMMGVQLLHESWRAGVAKFVAIGTVCAYPKLTPILFSEESLWEGYTEETNAPYGLAQKMLLVQAQAYHQQYGFNAIYLLPVNLYGPGDKFDPAQSHVIPALIRKFMAAKQSGSRTVEVWGSGRATREFLYVADAAEGIVLASERYAQPEPANLGSGMEISIRELAELIGRHVGFEGPIVFDASQPDGQPHRCLDTRRAQTGFGFRAQTPFEEGLRQTIQWYQDTCRQQPSVDLRCA